MACFTPLKAYRGSGGTVVFSSKEGFGDLPLELPCGGCTGCKVRRSREWALRCVHEASLHPANSFVTLTYTNNIRYVDHGRGPVRYGMPDDGSLDVRHWQLFVKRLRTALADGVRISKFDSTVSASRRTGFRYLHVGEYGAKRFRPHYHAVIFGQDFSGDRYPVATRGKDPLYASPLLDSLWGHGACSVGAVTYESAAYVAKYCLKTHGHEVQTERYRRIDLRTGEEYYVRREYCTMSRRPGIGSGWLRKFLPDVYPSDEVVHAGRTFGVPRYYDTLFEKWAQARDDASDSLTASDVDGVTGAERLTLAEFTALKSRRVQKALKFKDDATPERLRVREQVAAAALRSFSRDLD